jgi:uncharacterized iron-regulated protein
MTLRLVACALVIALGAGCAAHGPDAKRDIESAGTGTLAYAMRQSPIVLLGEVHDNAAQHVLRLQAFDALLATGARPALLMEQFDRERQGDIDRAREGARGNDGAGRVIAAASRPDAGWQWTFYKPFVERALEHGLPIVAVNVSREDTRGVIAKGLAAGGFDAEVPPDVEAGLAASIEAAHCGMVDGATARRMTAAQVARDQFMARSIARHAERGVLLLAGNGHTRRDLGVPRWMPSELRARSVSIGLLEEGDTSTTAFDHVFVTARQARADPCQSMRRPVARTPSAPAPATAM